jgi:hypothetical protein
MLHETHPGRLRGRGYIVKSVAERSRHVAEGTDQVFKYSVPSSNAGARAFGPNSKWGPDSRAGSWAFGPNSIAFRMDVYALQFLTV